MYSLKYVALTRASRVVAWQVSRSHKCKVFAPSPLLPRSRLPSLQVGVFASVMPVGVSRLIPAPCCGCRLPGQSGALCAMFFQGGKRHGFLHQAPGVWFVWRMLAATSRAQEVVSLLLTPLRHLYVFPHFRVSLPGPAKPAEVLPSSADSGQLSQVLPTGHAQPTPRLVTSGPQLMGVSFPDTGCVTRAEDESCPPATSSIARRGVSPNLADRPLAGTGPFSSVGARAEQRDVSFLSAFSGQLSQALDVTPARPQFCPGSVGQQEAGFPFANVERLLCAEDESFPPARRSSTCPGISSLPASPSPSGKGPAPLVVSTTARKDEPFPSGSIGQQFPAQSTAGPLSSTCDGSAVIAAEGGALHAPAQRCVGEALPRAFLPHHREQCQQADATSTVAPQEDESFPFTCAHCSPLRKTRRQRHPAARTDCLVLGRLRPAGPAGTDAGPGRAPRFEAHASHPLPGHDVSQREQDEIYGDPRVLAEFALLPHWLPCNLRFPLSL